MKTINFLSSRGYYDDFAALNNVEHLSATQDYEDEIGPKSNVPCQSLQKY